MCACPRPKHGNKITRPHPPPPQRDAHTQQRHAPPPGMDIGVGGERTRSTFRAVGSCVVERGRYIVLFLHLFPKNNTLRSKTTRHSGRRGGIELPAYPHHQNRRHHGAGTMVPPLPSGRHCAHDHGTRRHAAARILLRSGGGSHCACFRLPLPHTTHPHPTPTTHVPSPPFRHALGRRTLHWDTGWTVTNTGRMTFGEDAATRP